ncbi:MAG: TonB-dependent receptor [Ferruginibacter sp.]
MKLTAFILLTVCMQLSARSFSQKVTLSAKDLPLEQVIKKIKKQTGYSFFYNADWLQKAKAVTVEVRDMDIEDALNIVFKDQPLSYKVINNTIVLKLKEIMPVGTPETLLLNNLPPPPIDIRGRVVNEKGEALEGVTVTNKGTKQATATNNNGEFSLSVAKGSVLVFTYISYATQEVPVGSKTTFAITMQLQNSSLNDVVVIGYGTRLKKDVTGAISTVSAKEIEKSTGMTPELALQGKAAGVFIESGGGEPGARPTVRIRGVNTFGYSEPLYVIDGVPIFEGGAGVTTGGIGDIRSPLNIFAMINPSDIESMTVLKDASSAAIYGVRASNGVILITTKRGKSGKPRVDFSASYGSQKIAKSIKTLNTQQYFDLVKESYNNFPDANTTFAQKFGPLYDAAGPAYIGNGPTYDWPNELKNNSAILQDYNVKVSGGNDNTTYYFSGGYAKTQSPLKSNDLERYSLAFNIDSKISKYLQAGVNVRMMNQNALNNTQADLGTMMATIPFQPFYDKNDPTGFAAVSSGSFKPNPSYDPSKLSPGAPFVFDGNPVLLWGTQSRFNVFAFQAMNSTKYNILNTLGNAFVQIEPVTGLKLKGSLGGEYRINLRKTFNDLTNAWRFSQTPGNPYANQDGNAKGGYGERQGRTYNLNKELTLNYVHVFHKDHSIDVILGASEQYERWNWTDNSGNVDYLNPQFWAVNNIPPYIGSSAGILEEQALIGYLGRVSYKFQDKYYFDATVRRDGSSKLAPGNKFDQFPSFAAAWRISSEKFFPHTSFISDLKIRGGWGKLGNYQSAGAYQFLSNLSFSPDYALGSGLGNSNGSQLQGVFLPNFANKSLKWEKVKTTSVGIDAILLDRHVNFTAEYYSKTTYDIIQDVSLPPNTGIQQPASLNVATVSNSGMEFQLGYNTKIGDFNFNASGNLTTVRNRVLKLNDGAPIGGEGGRIEEGYSMFYLWGYKVGGIFQNQADIDKWKLAHPKGDGNIGGNVYKPGDMYFQDIYGDPRTGKTERISPIPDSVVNNSDRTYLGKTIPGYYYGLNLGANYKGIDVSIFFQGVGDVQKYNNVRSGLESMGSAANQWATTLNRWTTANPSSTMPRAVFGDPYATTRFSGRFVENASYLRLKNVSIGYTLPGSLISKLSFIQNFRLYVSGVNLFTITGYSGLDPENDLIPPTRQFIFGVSAAF